MNMIGQKILHLPRGIRQSELLGSHAPRLSKNSDIRVQTNLLPNGVNKIHEKLGEDGTYPA